MHNVKERLIEKGWSKKDITKTISIIEKAKNNKHPKIKILDRYIYWISLAVVIGGNFIISIALIPELISLKGFQLYAVVITLGISFGLLFELLIRTIEHLKTTHYILLGIMIPLLAITNFIIVSYTLGELIGIENPQNPFLLGSVYAISLMLPYFFYQTFLKNVY
jgi:hypothetical protein